MRGDLGMALSVRHEGRMHAVRRPPFLRPALPKILTHRQTEVAKQH